MYSCIKLNLYCEGLYDVSQNIKNLLINKGLPFKELRNSTLLFSAIKNPENVIILIVSSSSLLSQIKSFAKHCYNYQERLILVLKDETLNDNFFTNTFTSHQTDKLLTTLNSPTITNLHTPNQPSQLLIKLVQFELMKLQIPVKYMGFNYLTQLAVNYLCNNYSDNTYIELFEYVAGLNLASIDTIERDVRHMLLTTWRNNPNFRHTLQKCTPMDKPNSKNILNAILSHLKNTI